MEPALLPPIDYAGYLDTLRQNAAGAELAEYGRVEEGGRSFPLLSLTVPGQRWVVITSGFHGEERSGPLTLAERFAEIAAYARERGVGLHVFPCINPSGFEVGSRYNLSGERPNNDFLRYELEPGRWVGELQRGQPFIRWALYDGGPRETRAVRAALDQLPAPVAALDLHQDHHLREPLTYAYTFHERELYLPMVHASERLAPVARHRQVDVGQGSDADGLLEYHDGSVTDWYVRRGVRCAAALETTTVTPQAVSAEINLIWIRGFIDFAARRD